MRRVPRTQSDRLTWMKTHSDTWQANAATLGLAPTFADAVRDAVKQAREARLAAVQAQEAAVSATLNANTLLAAADRLVAAAIAQIEATAQQAENPLDVYTTAEIAPPASSRKRAASANPNGPADAPLLGTPSLRSNAIDANGAMTLRWECKNRVRGSVLYKIERRGINDPSNAWTTIGVAGKRQYVDRSLPYGEAGVYYKITPMAGTREGTANTFLVRQGAVRAETTATALARAA